MKYSSKTIALLGSTGSIGTQTLEVARAMGYGVSALAAGKNISLLEKQVVEFSPAFVALQDEAAADVLRQRLAGLSKPPQVLAGPNAAARVAELAEADIVLNAIVGFAGLKATLAALEAGKNVALANKESLVAGGSLVMDAVARNHVQLLPVDSEHSAIFQCLQDKSSATALQKILLTASGGPFFGKTRQELAEITPADALKHPNWSMGPKITVDSATLMNKGLELIEAMWLFSVPAHQIEIVVQPQSIVHSMVQFSDNSVLAQLGVPDMRLPIQYALTWPQRLPGPAPALDFDLLTQLTFGRPDEETFRCLPACRQAAQIGGLAPCAANAAGEEAVALFLQGEIGFLRIGELVEQAVQEDNYAGTYTIEDVLACDAAVRQRVRARAIPKG